MKSEKIGAMLTTVICTCSMFASMLSITADAATYDSCDVDRNGVVNILDVIALNRCMMGTDYLSDFNRMDADRNEVISHADVECILSKITGNSYYSEVDGIVSMWTSGGVYDTYMTNPITSMEYVKYNYKTKETSTYTLDITPASDNNARAITGVIGTDDRKYLTNQPEFTGIIRTEFMALNSDKKSYSHGANGTGFIVGDHQIATAAHCVYGKYGDDNNKYHFFTTSGLTKIRLYDKDGNQTGSTLTPVEVHIPKKYADNVNGTEDGTDYALITVEEDLSEYTHFTLGLVKDPYDYLFSSADIYISGIPSKVNNTGNGSNKIAKGKGKISNLNSNYHDVMLYYTTDSTNGNSGGPVYTITNYSVGNITYVDYTAIGIVDFINNGYNMGARIIPIIQKFYLSNPNMSY